MRAWNLRSKHLIGRKILTKRYGSWPGGVATIIEMNPDPEAPEIVCQVRHVTCEDPEHDDGRLFEVGVFEHEEVKLLPP